MASSGVKENVNLCITPTFGGVCGMLFYIIFDFLIYCQMIIYQYFWVFFDQLVVSWSDRCFLSQLF